MFGFLKNKLKEWVNTAKDKLKSETNVESSVSSETELAVPKKTKEKKTKKEKLATEKDVKRFEEEIHKTQEIVSKVEKGQETPEQAVEELEEEHEKSEKFFEESGENKEVSEQKTSFLSKIKSKFSYKIAEDDFNELFNDLETLLLENNVALEAVDNIKRKLSKKLIGKEISKKDLNSEIKKELKYVLEEILIEPDDPLDAIEFKKKNKEPFVILFFGINGTGKTTSIAKFAHLLKNKKFSVVLAAADTFRAASIEQISEHAQKLNLHLIKHNYGADPSAVGYDAIKYAKSHNINVVLIDTAGRMHTKSNLLEEMKKICRVTEPDLKIFVAESIAGNDAIEQAKTFNEMIEIDGSILTKADIDEKGGTIISISYATHKPIFYLGTGQKYSDLKLFNKQKFIKSLGL